MTYYVTLRALVYSRTPKLLMSTKIINLEYGIQLQLQQTWIDEPITVNPLEVPPVSPVSLSDTDECAKYQFFNFFRIVNTNSYVQCPSPQLRGLMITKISDRISNNSKIAFIIEDFYLDLIQLLTITAKKGIRNLTVLLMGDKIQQLCIALRKMSQAGETVITNVSIHEGCLQSDDLRQRIAIMNLMMSWLKSLKLTVNLQLIDDNVKYNKSYDLVIGVNRIQKDILTGNTIIKNWSITKKKFCAIDWVTIMVPWSCNGGGVGITIRKYRPLKSNTLIKLVDDYIIAENQFRIFNDVPVTDDGIPQGLIYRTNIYTKELSIIEVPMNYVQYLNQLEESYANIVAWINTRGDSKSRVMVIDEL